MSLRRVIIIFAIAFLCQLSFVNLFEIGNITPNLILCMAISLIYYYHEGYKCIPIATIAMIFLDMCGSQYLGVGALSLFIICLIVVVFRINLNTERLYPTLVTAAISIFMYYMIMWVIMHFMGSQMGFLYMLLHTFLYMVYDLIVIAITYAFISGKIIKKKQKIERESEVEIEV